MVGLGYVRKHVEIQGFRNLDDDRLARVAPWMRFTPAANILLVAVGTVLASPVVVGTAALLMAWGAVTRAHPFDRLYNGVVRPLFGGPRLPPSADRRRFVFAVAAAWLALTAAVLQAGGVTAGTILGGVLAVMIVPLAGAHVCLISEPMERLFGPARAVTGDR